MSFVAGLIGTSNETKDGLMSKSGFLNNRSTKSATSCDDLIQAGTYRINGESLGLPGGNYGMLVVFHSGDPQTRSIMQMFFLANSTTLSIRQKWTPSQHWSEWRTL